MPGRPMRFAMKYIPSFSSIRRKLILYARIYRKTRYFQTHTNERQNKLCQYK